MGVVIGGGPSSGVLRHDDLLANGRDTFQENQTAILCKVSVNCANLAPEHTINGHA